MFRGADKFTRNAQLGGAFDHVWRQIAWAKNINVAEVVADRARMFTLVEDRFRIISAFPNAARNEDDIIYTLKALAFNTTPSHFSYQYVELVKDKISDAEKLEQIKQLLPLTNVDHENTSKHSLHL